MAAYNVGDRYWLPTDACGNIGGHYPEDTKEVLVTITRTNADGEPYYQDAAGHECWAHENYLRPVEGTNTQPHFLIGDLVRLQDYSRYGDHERHMGEVAVIVDASLSGRSYKLEWTDGQTSNVHWKDDYSGMYKVNDNEPTKENEPMNNQSNTLYNPVAALRDKNLDEVTKTLRAAGLENGDGSRTSRANDVILDALWAERREQVAKDLLALEAAEKAPVSATEA